MGITRKALAALVVLMAGLLGGASVALAVTPTAVVVEDRAGVLDQRTLLPAVRSTDFYQPTKVAIYTYNGTAADNLNTEVLRFARAEHPEWISADGQKWADGLFIFALDPVGRHVGTYMGEDRKVSPEQREDIQNAAKELLRDAQWTDGTVAGIRRGAELINQPWYRSTAFLVTAWTAVAAAVCGAAAWLILRWRTRVSSRKELARGDASYANVSMDLQVTELNASTIPESSRYGSTVLEKHRTFVNRYNAATGLSNQVHALGNRDLGRRSNLKLVRSYADAAAELDALDDVIADTNALLNRGSAWASAWDRQLEPFRSDLDDLETMLSQRRAEGIAGLRQVDGLAGQRLRRGCGDADAVGGVAVLVQALQQLQAVDDLGIGAVGRARQIQRREHAAARGLAQRHATQRERHRLALHAAELALCIGGARAAGRAVGHAFDGRIEEGAVHPHGGRTSAGAAARTARAAAIGGRRGSTGISAAAAGGD